VKGNNPVGGGNVEKTNLYHWGFETITKHMLDVILIINQDRIITYVTPTFEDMLGYNVEEVIGENAFALVYEEDRERLEESFRKVINHQEQRTDEYRIFHKNGELKFLEAKVTPVPNYPEKIAVVSIRDITVRKQVELEIQQRKDRYEELLTSLKRFSTDISNMKDEFVLIDRLLKEIKDMIPQSEPNFVVFDHSFEKSPAHHFILGKLHTVGDDISVLLGRRKSKEFVLTVKGSPLHDPMVSKWFETIIYYTNMVFESINSIENLMEQLETTIQRNEKPQWILRLLFNLSEKQRLQLSSDLHHSILHEQIHLQRKFEEMLTEQHFNEDVTRKLDGILNGMMDTIHQIKITCNELRPPMLKELGLIKSLENLFEYTQLSSTYKIFFEFNDYQFPNLNEEVTIGVYRIVQELLNNATKHSKATELHFFLQIDHNRLKLQYKDNGLGLDVNQWTPSFKSMGLSGMRERAHSLNGKIHFASEVGNGLKVELNIPTDA